MPWSEADFADLEATREVQGRLGVQYLPLIAGKPDIGVDLSGVANAILSGHLDNDHLLARVMAIPEGPPAEPTPDAPKPDAPEPSGMQAVWDVTRKVLDWQDAVLEAFIVDPPYTPLRKLPRGGRVPGTLCCWDFTADERRAAIGVIYAPAERLATFRDESARALAGADVQGVRGLPERPDSAADDADLPEAVAGREPVPALATARGRRPGGAA